MHALDKNTLTVYNPPADARRAVAARPRYGLKIDFATSDVKIRQELTEGEHLVQQHQNRRVFTLKEACNTLE